MTRLQQVRTVCACGQGEGPKEAPPAPQGTPRLFWTKSFPGSAKAPPPQPGPRRPLVQAQSSGAPPRASGGGQRHLPVFRSPPRLCPNRMRSDSRPGRDAGGASLTWLWEPRRGSPGPLGEHTSPNLGFNFVQRPFVTGQEDTAAVSFPLDVLAPPLHPSPPRHCWGKRLRAEPCTGAVNRHERDLPGPRHCALHMTH